jgi:hypothetical protein
MRHVRFHEMTRTQRTVERQFTRQDTSSDNAGEQARVVTRRGGVGAADAEEVKHGGLGL